MRIGIDWGGTKIEAIALSDAGAVLARRRITTPQHDYEACIAAASGLVREIEMALGQTGTIGIGIPGAISPATSLVKNANSVWLNGRPLDTDMAQALVRSVRVENDANCLAVSEAVDGAAAGAAVVWAVILGTGAGSGIAVKRPGPLVGRHRITGEWGHNPLPWPRDDERPGPACYCGRQGCLETFVSGTGIAAGHRRRSGTGTQRRGDRARHASRRTGRAADLRSLPRPSRARFGACGQHLGAGRDRVGRGLSAVDESMPTCLSMLAIRLLGRVQYTGASEPARIVLRRAWSRLAVGC